MKYDVIIVGAGPSDSTTANECADRGLTVLLLDKAEFPRNKPCGEGVTVRASELVPFDISPVTDRVIDGIHLSTRQSNGFARRYPRDLVYLTRREKLDAFLVEKATTASAVLREKAPLRSVKVGGGDITFHTPDQAFHGRVLVSADGSNGVTSKMAGLNIRLVQGIALEANVTPRSGGSIFLWSGSIPLVWT